MTEVTSFLEVHGAPALFAVVFLDQAGLPVPCAPWLVAAGAFSACGKMSITFAIGISVVACLCADWLWFCVGRRGARRILRLLFRLSRSPALSVRPTTGLFAGHGERGLVISKFLPGLAMAVPALTGALGVSAGRFLLYDGVGSLLYSAVYILVGFLFHNQVQEALAVLNELGFSALLLALVLVPACVAFKCVCRRQLFLGRGQHTTTGREEGGAAVRKEEL